MSTKLLGFCDHVEEKQMEMFEDRYPQGERLDSLTFCDQMFDWFMPQYEYVRDPDNPVHIGKVEHWSSKEEIEAVRKKIGRYRGDCDDPSAWWWATARKHGYDARIVESITETGERHAFALVDERWALDIRLNRVVHITHLTGIGYQIVRMTGFDPGDDPVEYEGVA